MRISTFISVAALAAALSISGPTVAQGLLGGVGGAVTSTVESITGGSGSDPVGVSGVADTSVGSDNGTQSTTRVLGGGNDLRVPLRGVTGDNSAATVSFPDLDDILSGGDGFPGSGGAGGNGNGSGNGNCAGNGGSRIADTGGGSGMGNSSRTGAGLGSTSNVRMLQRILQQRAWLDYVQGSKVCLPTFSVSNMAPKFKKRDFAALSRVLQSYRTDIKTLQRALARCNNGQRDAMNVKRVIGVQARSNGSLVVVTL